MYFSRFICICVGGFQPPLDDWKKILDDMNTKARKLEEDYEVTCTMKKVCQQIYRSLLD